MHQDASAVHFVGVAAVKGQGRGEGEGWSLVVAQELEGGAGSLQEGARSLRTPLGGRSSPHEQGADSSCKEGH